MKIKHYTLFLLLTILNIVGILSNQEDEPNYIRSKFKYNCLPLALQKRNINSKQINILTTHDVFNQLTSRIFAIYLREVLRYRFVDIIEIKFPKGANERYKIHETIEHINDNTNVIDLNIPIPIDYQFFKSEAVAAGSIGKVHFGWFIPKKLINTDKSNPFIPYTILQDPSKEEFQQFVLDDLIAKQLDLFMNNCSYCEKYSPYHCKEKRCATVLSSHHNDTSFAVHFINEYKLHVKIYWLGDYLQSVKNQLIDILFNRNNNTVSDTKSFLILHWTPSEIISNDYEMLLMPHCEHILSRNETNCKYDLTPLVKYYSSKIKEDAPIVQETLYRVAFDDEDKENLFDLYQKATTNQYLGHLNELDMSLVTIGSFSTTNRSALYNDIACKWFKNNEKKYKDWIPVPDNPRIYIAGVFPSRSKTISEAAKIAQEAVTNNQTLLKGIALELHQQRVECHSENVMDLFVNIYRVKEDIVGVLGPHCSEMLEPLASTSKYFQLPVITYSAEGTSFYDRVKYPYSYRTIGENRQFVNVYKRLFKEFQWRRVAAFAEDNPKYSEYISHIENVLHQNDIEFVLNRKFPKPLTSRSLIPILSDIKRKNAKIIIAEIDDDQTEIVMCEAYKLQMTAQDGYVWFLPAYMAEKWRSTNGTSYCGKNHVEKMLNGHFFLNHAPFGDENSTMQENKTVKEWKKEYFSRLNSTDIYDINYVGYAYDAFWVYALALDKLNKENPDLLQDNPQNSTKRLIEYIANTSFTGLSGKIKFGEGGSRFSATEIFQHINEKSRVIGSFDPNTTEENGKLTIVGGRFHIDQPKIKWLTPNRKMPNDGTTTCNFEFIANLVGMECTTVHYILIGLLCFILVIIISVASFTYWKRKYDMKLKQSAKVMRNFGIDLLSPKTMPANTLDKWEISKDHVVINRRLGEGAFGTVYGGEAQLTNDGWTAVAVKTLKKGSNTEDRLDFLSEAEAMKRFDHTNIVKLLGVCLQSEPIYTIMEFMLYGDLKTYLLARRHLVNQKISEDSDFSPKRLTMMALDIARALSYLAEQKYVHRDVACRNCLVNAQRVVKLGDFGMARSMFESDYYRFSRKGMLPVRWMAPESLILGIFTPASDVWSFGVLLYEIISFGSFPFQGLTNTQVLEHIKAGHTLTIPNGVKPPLEGLMNACWNATYKKRPSASEVAHFISQYPRLLSPCLDVPLASVQMPETDSDQLELLPGLRKRHNQSMNDLHRSSTATTLEAMTSTLPNGITLRDFNNPSDDSEPSTNGAISNTYNPIEPLLQHETEMCNNDPSLWRYVPMNGTRKKNKSLERVNTSVI